MNLLSPHVLYFKILKQGKSICMYHTRDDIYLKFLKRRSINNFKNTLKLTLFEFSIHLHL
jgi:hypothetical protein